MMLKFMGYEFEKVEHLRRAFPAFAGDDAIRAIKAGAQTPLEVEIACLEYRKASRQRTLKAARANAKVVNEASRKSRERKAKKANLPPIRYGREG